jgi:hypothetical protein
MNRVWQLLGRRARRGWVRAVSRRGRRS